MEISGVRMLIGLLIGIALLIVLMLKTKIQAFLALILCTIVVGVIGGMPLTATDIVNASGEAKSGVSIVNSIIGGFGGTLGNSGSIIGFGVMLGQIFAVSGAAKRIPSPTGKEKWHGTTINSMLTNPCYKGVTIRQKTFTTDFLTHKNKKNEGELPQYIIENSHPAIIPEETWELVQLEMERRRRMGNRFSAKGPLASRLVCADCGAFFGAKVWHSQDRYRTTVWRCNDKYSPNAKRASGGEKCSTGHVTEGQVYEAFQGIVNKLIAQRPEVVEACEAVLGDLMNTADLDAKKERLEAEQKRITGKVEALMNKASREVVGDFTEAYGKLEAERDRLAGKLEAVDREKGERGYRERQCKLFLKTVSSLGGSERADEGDTPGEKFVDKEVFLALVDKVVVGDGLRFILRDGTEWTV